MVTYTVDNIHFFIKFRKSGNACEKMVKDEKKLYLASRCTTHAQRHAIGPQIIATRVATTLILSDNKLKEKGATWVSSLVNANPRLTRLNLSNNDLKVKGMAIIAKTVCENPITHLNVSSNNLGPEGAVRIAEMLFFDSKIKSLRIGCNDLGPLGMACLMGALTFCDTLKTFRCSSNDLGSSGALVLSKTFTLNNVVTTLGISDNDLFRLDVGIQEIADMVRFNSTITDLDLGGNMLEARSTIKPLTKALAVNFTLKTLHLSHNVLSVDAVRRLCDAVLTSNTLTDLVLVNTRLDDGCVPHLVRLIRETKSLEALHITRNRFDHGMYAIVPALANNTTIREFAIEKLYYDIAFTRTLAAFFMTNKTVTSLDTYPYFDAQLMTYLTPFMRHNPGLLTTNMYKQNRTTKNAEVNQILDRNATNTELRNITFTELLLLKNPNIDTTVKKQRSL